MSLLQNQDFVIYRIRNRYLSTLRDGERLITVNPTTLNSSAFKNAGWGSAADFKQRESPPIHVGAPSEYFPSTAAKSLNDSVPPILPRGGNGRGSRPADETSLKLGSRFSSDSTEIGNGTVTRKSESLGKGPKRPKQVHREDDDSSDMSEESEMDEESNHSNPQKAKFDFAKKEIPIRPRSGSSPVVSHPQVLVTSPAKSRAPSGRIRGGSHGAVDFSSKQIATDKLSGADEDLLSSRLVANVGKVHADIARKLRSSPNSSLPRDDGFGHVSGNFSDASSSLSSNFTETADSNPAVIGNSLSPPTKPRVQESPAVLHALPPPIRPVSQIQPVSMLTLMIKAKQAEKENPMESYRLFSGKGELNPIVLKIYMPYARASSPFEVVLKKQDDSRRETTVAEAIAFTLYRYIEDKKEPKLKEDQCDINKWALRMVDDGEPDDDFPPLERLQPVTTYIVKRGRGGRLGGAARDMKLEGELALVEATEEQYAENCRVTPSPAPNIPFLKAGPPSINTHVMNPTPSSSQTPSTPTAKILRPPLEFMTPTSTSTPRTGPSKILRIHLSMIDEFSQSVSVCVTSDTYIAEVLDQVCKKKHLDKTKYILRLNNPPGMIVPLDRTVASLGDRDQLDLVKRRFVTDGMTTGSSVPEPGALLSMGSGEKGGGGKKGKFLAQGESFTWIPELMGSKDYLKFTVFRKASMSFMSRHERILAIDGEYVHIMPSDQKTLFESSSKTTSIHISTIIGCKTYRKAPNNFKIVVLKPQRESKRYDFEAVSEEQAGELVAALRKAMMSFRMDRE
ncbi:Component of a membrane-bound complex containing the Tor2p kinase [Rhizina undulata]